MAFAMRTLLEELEKFILDTGLSEHRVGVLLARNGRLVPRLRGGKRIWPETETRIREAMENERGRRDLIERETGNHGDAA
jgi:hypothetical protein